VTDKIIKARWTSPTYRLARKKPLWGSAGGAEKALPFLKRGDVLLVVQTTSV